MPSTPSSIAFTALVEPSSNVTQSPPPAPFDAGMAYLLGQCCSLSYAEFNNPATEPDFSSLSRLGSLQGYTISASNWHPFTTWEADEPGAIPGDVGDYYQVSAGFGVQLTLTPSNGGEAQNIVVITLRGSRTWTEWLNNTDAFPIPFGGITNGLGSVHAGFYGRYTVGTNGKVETFDRGLSSTPGERASYSIAAQVADYVTGLKGRLPIYVTGHSLGGALATLCALDIASNFSQHFSEIYMYSLASPRVAVGCSNSLGLPVLTLNNQVGFLSQYQRYVPNSYQIVHAADIVPILPFLSIKLGPLTLSCLHVTEPYQIPGSGATATASLNADGGVANVQVDNGQSTGYSTSFPPRVVLSGGGGTGAIAQASVSLLAKNVEVTVTNSGSGYTSAPTVQILSSGSLAGNVISFCAQTGDIANNHSCANVYVPYLAQLASNFQAS